ncbi:MAG: ATP-binding protein [Rickettsiales bacterium]|nr:ATP-binding protein [Rickettsiales bacterium]
MSAITRIPRVRNLILFSSIIMLLFCGIITYQAKESFDDALSDSQNYSQKLNHILSDHTELTFLAADLTLRRVVERNYFNDLFGGNIPEDLMHNIRKWVDETPQIAAMLVLDEAGRGLLGAHKKGYENWIDYRTLDFGDAKFFQKMRGLSDRFFWISKLKRRDDSGKELIIISRRISKLNGEFGGLVIAAIDPMYLTEFFKSIHNYDYSQMQITLADGTILLEGPERENSTPLHEQINAQTAPIKDGNGILRENGDIHIYSRNKLRNLPLTITIMLDERDFLATWWDLRSKDFSFLTIFLIFGSILSFFAITMAKQITRVEKSEASAVLASQAKSEFLANMSHELRTPLNAIIGFSEMLNSGYFGPLNPKQKERIHDINLCGSHLLQLISDILEFSKGEAGKLDLNEEKIDLGETVNETLRMMNEKIRSKAINVGVDIEKDLPRVWGDKRKIRQILLNLLSNAVKFTPENGNVKIALRLDNQRNIALVVTDTGVGIPEDKIATALSVFGQVHRAQSHEGTGLGLPLCKMFAELHGGRLAIGSTEGEGTTIRITLPRQRVIFDEADAENFVAPKSEIELAQKAPALLSKRGKSRSKAKVNG